MINATLYRRNEFDGWQATYDTTNVSSVHDAKFNFDSVIQTNDRIVLGDGSEGVFEYNEFGSFETIASGPSGRRTKQGMEGK